MKIEFEVQLQKEINLDKEEYKTFVGMSKEAQKSFLFDQVELNNNHITKIVDVKRQEEITEIIGFVDEQFHGYSNLPKRKEFLKEILGNNSHIYDQCDILWSDEDNEFVVYDFSNDNEINKFTFEELKGIVDVYEI